MQLLEPEIVAAAASLSLPLPVTALVLGLALWAFGWRTHRFWVALIMTVLAGIWGLYEAPVFQAQPVLASLLLAVAAGVLALALVRVLAFVAGGAAGIMLLTAVAPGWNQPLVIFLVSGLIGLALFRFWMMTLTSFTGTLLSAYAGLSLLQRSGNLDIVAWAETGSGMFNWACGLLTLVGVTLQFFLERRKPAGKDKKSGKSSSSGEPREFLLALPLLGWKGQRKAG